MGKAVGERKIEGDRWACSVTVASSSRERNEQHAEQQQKGAK